MRYMPFLILCMIPLLVLSGCGERMDEVDTAQSVIADAEYTPAPSGEEEVSASSAPDEAAGESRIIITVGSKEFTAVLEDNDAAKTLMERLPFTLDMSELNGNEKYFYMDEGLPTDSQRPGQINSGDLMLYGDNCLVLFYESFSSGYSYTRLGRIEAPAGLAEALGSGGVTVTFAAGE